MLSQDIFEPFFEANEHNFLIINENPLNCSDRPSFRWLLNKRDLYKSRVLKAFCSDRTEFWSLPNVTEPTTSVTTTERTEDWTSPTDIVTTISEADDAETETETTTEVHQTTDPDIENPGSSEKPCNKDCDNDSDNDDNTIHEINDRLQDLIDMTNEENKLNTSEQLIQIVDQIQGIRLTMDSMTPLDYESAFNMTNNVIKVLSNLLNQNNAWLKTSDELRTEVASHVLNQIQLTSFFLTCNRKNSNKTIETLINDNIVVNLYENYGQQILFEANDSSILIPEEVLNQNLTNHCGNSSFAALINRIDNYLWNRFDQEQDLNTQLVGFSMTNKSNIVQFDDDVFIRIRYIIFSSKF